MVCFTHCTDNVLKPTGPNKCLLTNLGVEVWVGSFKVGRIVEVFAVRVGVVFKVEDINDFFRCFAKGCCMAQKKEVHSVQPSSFASYTYYHKLG